MHSINKINMINKINKLNIKIKNNLFNKIFNNMLIMNKTLNGSLKNIKLCQMKQNISIRINNKIIFINNNYSHNNLINNFNKIT